MTKEERVPIYEEALKEFGAGSQMIKAIEEFSELTKELAKELLYGDPKSKEVRYAIVDELADCTIMVEQMTVLFDMDTAVNDVVKTKIDKLKKTLEEAKNGSR